MVQMIDFIKHNLKTKSEMLAQNYIDSGVFTEKQLDAILQEIWLQHLSQVQHRGDAFIEASDINRIIKEACHSPVDPSIHKVAAVSEIIKAVMREQGFSSENVGSKVVVSIF